MAKSKSKPKPNAKQRQLLRDRQFDGMLARIAAAFLVTITAFYPIYLSPRAYLGITYDKTLFLWVTAAVASALVLFMFVCAKGGFRLDNYYVAGEPRRRVAAAEWALLGFIAWAFLSAFVAHWMNPEWMRFDAASGGAVSIRPSQIVWRGYFGRYEGFFSYLAYAVCFAITARLYKPRRLHMLLIAGGAVIVSLIGILQFVGVDFLPWRPDGQQWTFGLFPFDLDHRMITDIYGNRLMGPTSAFFRTTLGNVNLVSAYCSFAVLLFAALFAASRSKSKGWRWLYFGACALSFALSFTTGHSGDAHIVAIFGAMVLLVPYWISCRVRLGRVLLVLASWCAVYAAHNAYMTAMQRRLLEGGSFPPSEAHLLYLHSPAPIWALFALGGVLLAGGLALLLIAKKWLPARPLRIACAAAVPVLLISGMVGLEIVGSRLSDQPGSFVWQAREMMHFRMDDSFGSGRGFIWRNAVEVIPYNPIFGTGPDTFYYALGGFGGERQTLAAELHGEVYDKAHNVFLQIAVCMGIPALVAYLIFLGGVFIPAVKAAFDRPVLLAFGAAALSYVIQGFFMVEVPITTPLVWIAFGVIAAETWMAKIGCQSADV